MDGRLSTPYVPVIHALPLLLLAAKEATSFGQLSRSNSAVHS